MSILVSAMKTCSQGHLFATVRCPHCASRYQRQYYTTKVKTSQAKWNARALYDKARYAERKQDPAWVALNRIRTRITHERRAICRLQDRIERKEIALLRLVKQRDLAADRLRGKISSGGVGMK